jgi:hypothetical protein
MFSGIIVLEIHCFFGENGGEICWNEKQWLFYFFGEYEVFVYNFLKYWISSLSNIFRNEIFWSL